MVHSEFMAIKVGDKVKQGSNGVTRTVRFIFDEGRIRIVYTNHVRGIAKSFNNIDRMDSKQHYSHWFNKA